jgi:predicted transcriptional regulator of viral defense system
MMNFIKSNSNSSLKPERFLASRPVFSTAELDDALCSRWGGDPAARQSWLRYHLDRGRLLRVRRGFYAVVPEGTDPSSASPDPYLVGSRLAEDAVLAYQTALALRGFAHSQREEIVAVSHASVRPFRFRGVLYRTVKPPRSLSLAGEESAEVVTIDRSGLDARATSLERTAVDLLDRPDLGGGWEEVWRSLESVPYLDLDAVVGYALLLGSAPAIAATGLFLETHRESLMVEPRHLDALRRRIPRQPRYLDRSLPGRLVAGWNLIAPRILLEPPWAEGL